jgi:two-component system OmpR family sensor kinase
MSDAAAPSIRRALIGRLALGLLVAIVVAGIATYLRAREEANELFDYQLTQMASSVTGMPLAAAGPLGAGPGADALVVEIWDRSGVEVYLSQPKRRLPQSEQRGFDTVRTDTGEWRVFSTLVGNQVVQVAQPMHVRRELATSMALRTILPLLAVVPFLAVFVWFGIARSLRPLESLARDVEQRSPLLLTPLPESGLPREVRPLVLALNGLLARLDTAQDAQRAFIADAAHELRTPLTAVHLQAQLVERAGSDAERGAALGELKAGLDRATRLVAQLLTLAREEPGVQAAPFAPVALGDLARAAVAEHAAQALAAGVDLGLADATPALVSGDAPSLRTLLSNLVDNAVRYTPRGGRVDVGVMREDGAVALTVRDSGPGIPAEERERVFDRFHRGAQGSTVAGNGLGLAIVKRIAERHGATIALGTGLGSGAAPGLGVTVRFAAAPGEKT